MYLYTYVYTFTHMCILGIFTYTLYIYAPICHTPHVYSYTLQPSLIQPPIPFTYTNQPGTYTFIPLRQPNNTYQYMQMPYNHIPTFLPISIYLSDNPCPSIQKSQTLTIYLTYTPPQ